MPRSVLAVVSSVALIPCSPPAAARKPGPRLAARAPHQVRRGQRHRAENSSVRHRSAELRPGQRGAGGGAGKRWRRRRGGLLRGQGSGHEQRERQAKDRTSGKHRTSAGMEKTGHSLGRVTPSWPDTCPSCRRNWSRTRRRRRPRKTAPGRCPRSRRSLPAAAWCCKSRV